MAGTTVLGQAMALAPATPDCPSEEPDSLQISWTQPCEEGDWLLDTQTGCRMWDWHPDAKDRAVWSGACPGGEKQGRGVAQWYEHVQPIDRFEGTYRDGKREGFGRYVWKADVRFEGQYANDLPHGRGTATVLGESFSGTWRSGCFRKGDKVVAIGVGRTTCAHVSAQLDRPGAAAF
ncbi:MAG TPA: hypothetical protein VLA02_04285 [Reyranella sp.]|nr:hypothetical protein [Reyranella sp.]